MTDLSQKQYTFASLCPATPEYIMSTMGNTRQAVHDLAYAIRQKGYEVYQNDDGEYVVNGGDLGLVHDHPDADGERSGPESRRILAEIEYSLRKRLDGNAPVVADAPRTDDGIDLVMQRGDDHIGERATDEIDEEFNMELACSRVWDHVSDAVRIADEHGHVDTLHLVMGGDHLTGDTIHKQQPFEVEAPVEKQLAIGSDLYVDVIHALSEEFPHVQVVASPGNHGRLGYETPSNADNMLFDAIEMALGYSDIDNVTFTRNGTQYYTNFEMRGHKGHLRHGHGHSLEHIGTPTARERWGAWLTHHEFDVAFRQHFHMLREEPIQGRPVFMGGTLQPTTGYEESRALFSRPGAYTHGVTDDEPAAFSERLYF